MGSGICTLRFHMFPIELYSLYIIHKLCLLKNQRLSVLSFTESFTLD
jgi:hypothetical protein